MAITFKLDKDTNDLDFIGKGVNFVSSNDTNTKEQNREWRTQNLKTKLQQFVGDWYKDIEDGVPYFQEILGKKGTKAELDNIETIFRTKILEDGNEINSILEYSQELLSNRQLKITFSVLDIESQVIEFEEVLP